MMLVKSSTNCKCHESKCDINIGDFKHKFKKGKTLCLNHGSASYQLLKWAFREVKRMNDAALQDMQRQVSS